MKKSEGKSNYQEVTVPIEMEVDIATARIAAHDLARRAGLNQIAEYSVVICVSELAYNIYFHAGVPGSITCKLVESKNRKGIEIRACDNGKGIEDLELALADGFSTNRGLGGGLPGVRRLMDEFEISSTPKVGTVVIARKWGK